MAYYIINLYSGEVHSIHQEYSDAVEVNNYLRRHGDEYEYEIYEQEEYEEMSYPNEVWYVVKERDASIVSKHIDIHKATVEMLELNEKVKQYFVITDSDYEKLYAIKEFHVFGIGRYRDDFRHSEIIEARTRLRARDIFEKRNPELRAVADCDLTVE